MMTDAEEENEKKIVFPTDLSKWSEIKERLNKLQKLCISENIDFEDVALLHQQVYNVCNGRETKLEGKTRDKQARNCIFGGLVRYLNKVASIEEKDKFIYSTFPFIISLALMLEKYVPKEGLTVSKQQQFSRTSLNRKFVACIMACSFLCLLPNRIRDKTSTFKSKLKVTNFNFFFIHLPKSSQCAKFKCIINYFERISESWDTFRGKVTFTRQVLKVDELPTIDLWQQCNIPLCPMSVFHEGVMEDAGSCAMQVDFANKSIGGGVLGRSAVQEEIKFCECPELMVSMLFMETMESNEAIIIEGFEQFSSHTGYASALQYGGDFQDPAKRTRSGNLENIVCAIDAVPYKKSRKKQYVEEFLLQDLSKALTGFCCLDSNDDSFEDASDDEYITASETSHDQDDHLETITKFAEQLSESICTSSIETVSEHFQSNSKKKHPVSQTNNTVGSSEHKFDHMDYLDVDYTEWLWRFRRRSSNLSDLSSRRSSSSPRYSSDFSSEFEDYYEAFQKREKLKNGIIEEEVCDSPINEFASTLIESLLQAGTSTAAQITPRIQNFHQDSPETVVRPTPVKSTDSDFSDINLDPDDNSRIHLLKEFTSIEMDEANSFTKCSSGNDLPSSSSSDFLLDNFDSDVPANSVNSTQVYEKFADDFLSNFFPLSSNVDICTSLRVEEKNNNAIKEFDTCDAASLLVTENVTCPQCSVCVYQDPIDFFAKCLSGEIIQEAIDNSVEILQHFNAHRPPLLSRDSEETLCYRDTIMNQQQMSASFNGTGIFPYESHSLKDNSSDIVMESTADMHSTPGLSFTAADIIVSSPNSYSHFENSLLSGSSNLSTSLEKGSNHMKKTAKVLSFDSCSEISSQRAAADMSFEIEEMGTRTQFASNLSKDHMMDAYLKVQCKSNGSLYWRRSSEPYPSTQDDFLPFVSSSLVETQQRPRSQQKIRMEEDLMSNLSDDLNKQETSQMNGRPRRSSSGFRDPVLSQFAEELMKCTNNVPKFVPNGSRSESADSRRSSLKGFKDPFLANLEDELLATNVKYTKSWRDCSSCRSSIGRSSKYKRSHSFDVFDKKRPLVTRGPGFHSRPVWSRSTSSSGSCPDLTELYETAERITLAVVEEAYSIVYREKLEVKKLNEKIHKWKLDKFASNISNEIMKEAYDDLRFIYADRYYNASDEFHTSSKDSSICSEFQDAFNVVYSHINSFADQLSCSVIEDAKNVVKRHLYLQNHIRSRGRPIATGNWGCGAFGGDPQLKAMLQWMAASYARTTGMSYYAFCDGRLLRLQDVVDLIQDCNWTIGHLMQAIQAYCSLQLRRGDKRITIPDDLLEFLMDILRKSKS